MIYKSNHPQEEIAKINENNVKIIKFFNNRITNFENNSKNNIFIAKSDKIDNNIGQNINCYGDISLKEK